MKYGSTFISEVNSLELVNALDILRYCYFEWKKRHEHSSEFLLLYVPLGKTNSD